MAYEKMTTAGLLGLRSRCKRRIRENLLRASDYDCTADQRQWARQVRFEWELTAQKVGRVLRGRAAKGVLVPVQLAAKIQELQTKVAEKDAEIHRLRLKLAGIDRH